METRKMSILRRTLFLTGWLLISGHSVFYGQQITQRFPQETLPERMARIARITNERIVYDQSHTKEVMAPPVDAKDATAEEVIRQSLSGTGYTYAETDNIITIYKSPGSADGSANPPATLGRGKVAGKVLDDRGELLTGATIKVVSGTQRLTGSGTATGLDGDFSLDLPAGTYTLEVGFIGYQTQRVTDVKVVAGRNTPLDVKLEAGRTELEEVVITATYNQASAQGLYARQKSIAAMSDGVSGDMIKKTSDNNVAQTLRRVSGVTIDNGKYVTVRGMSERYNNVQLNGASLPSTEPNRRNFAFDVIPTGLVDNVTISKTFTPDLIGEFTGGLVEVNTLAVPDKRFLNLSVGSGWNSVSTGKDFLSNQRFDADWFRGEIDQRKWYTGRTEEETQQNIINAGKKNTYGLGKYTAQPLQNYSLTAGIPFDLGKSSLGVVAAVTYRHEENKEDILEGHMVTGDSIIQFPDKGSHRYKAVTTVGAVANVGWQMPGHSVTWRNLFNNRFSHTNHQRFIHKAYEGYRFVDQYSVPLVSSLWQTQLDGKHDLFGGKLIATWNGSYNNITRTNPDDRFIIGGIVGESPDGASFIDWGQSTSFANELGTGHIMYSNLNEIKKNVAVNIEYPFVVSGNRQSLKAGYMGSFRDATFEQQYLKAMGGSGSLRGLSIKDYFDPGFFENNILRYVVSGMQGKTADYYEGTQDIHAGYLMGDFGFWKKLRLIGGVRMEKTDMAVTTQIYENTVGGGIVDSTITINRTDWLPAATLIYSITPELNVRASYGKTLARPDFRELSRSSYFNVDDRVWVAQWFNIEQSYTHNYDLRLEWYPRPGEVLSASYFQKKFIKPVEMILRIQTDQVNYDLIPMNLDESVAKGFEVNWRKSLGFIAPATRFLSDLYLTGNYTWMKANVKYNVQQLLNPNIENHDPQYDRDRPLQGLSPYTLNLGLAYEGAVVGAAVNYNRNGRKLVLAGEFGYDDQFENPRDVLDIQISARFLKEQRLELKLNASDILNQDIIVYRNRAVYRGEDETTFVTDLTSKGMDYNDGDWVISRIRKGVNFSVSASYRF